MLLAAKEPPSELANIKAAGVSMRRYFNLAFVPVVGFLYAASFMYSASPALCFLLLILIPMSEYEVRYACTPTDA